MLFRDRHARVGLLLPSRHHALLRQGRGRRRPLLHGWKFGTEGHCLEQPCEPGGGLFKDKVRQRWYPVQERYGLIFAFLRLSAKMPVLPRYECLALTATCFGQGVGPLAVGMVNDALKNDYGANAVRYSLLSAAVTTSLGALLFVWAARTIRGDIKRAT